VNHEKQNGDDSVIGLMIMENNVIIVL